MFSRNPPSCSRWRAPTASTSLPVSGNQTSGTVLGSLSSCVSIRTVCGLRDVRWSLRWAIFRSLLGGFCLDLRHIAEKWPIPLQAEHVRPSAGQGDLVWAVLPQFGHFGGTVELRDLVLAVDMEILERW